MERVRYVATPFSTILFAKLWLTILWIRMTIGSRHASDSAASTTEHFNRYKSRQLDKQLKPQKHTHSIIAIVCPKHTQKKTLLQDKYQFHALADDEVHGICWPSEA